MNKLEIPLEGIDISELTSEQTQKLIEKCQYTIMQFLSIRCQCGRLIEEYKDKCATCYEEEANVIDCIPIDEEHGLYREASIGILIQQDNIKGECYVKGFCKNKNHKILLPLNSREIKFCENKNLVVSDFEITAKYRRNFQARKILKVWKKYWYEKLDSDGEVKYIKYIKSKIPLIT